MRTTSGSGGAPTLGRPRVNAWQSDSVSRDEMDYRVLRSARRCSTAPASRSSSEVASRVRCSPGSCWTPTVALSGVAFEERGAMALEGVSREWWLFAVSGSTSRTYQAFTGTPLAGTAGRRTTDHDDACLNDPQRRRHRSRCSGRSTPSRPQPELGGFHVPRHEPLARRRAQPHHDQGLLRRRRRRTRTRAEAFVLDAGEPAVLLGTDTGPNPAELRAARAGRVPDDDAGVRRRRPRGAADRGRVDARGRDGRARRPRPRREEVRNGFTQIRVTFPVKGDAPPEKLREIVERAPDALRRLRHGLQRRAGRGRRPIAGRSRDGRSS